MTWQAAGVFMHSDALVDSPVEKMDLVPTAALQEARAMTQRIGVEAPRTHRGSRQWLQRWRRRRRRRLRLRRLRPGGLRMEGGVHGKASAQMHTKHKTLVAFLKHRLQGLQKVASSFRPLFCGRAYSAKYEQVSKNGRPFSN